MKIFNIKLNFRAFIIFLCIIIFILSLFFLYSVFSSKTIKMNDKNYTQILKEVHDNPTKYINKEIHTKGYIFRAKDFKENQFVTARDMIISDEDYRIVGFLCESNKIGNYDNNTWIEIKGIIRLKDYHGPMPIIEVTEIKKIKVPKIKEVFPPKN